MLVDEAAICQIWGGPLCVSHVDVSAAELVEVRDEVAEELGDRLLFSEINVPPGRVHVGVAVDRGLQGELDERFGSGNVEVVAQLQPLER